jgi:hypothetical protein
MRNLYIAVALTAALLTAGCASSGISQIRFRNQPPITKVNDRKNIPNKLDEHKFYKSLYHFDGFFHRRFTRWTEFRATDRALGVNSIDEVPDSTWFTNRIGIRDMTPEEVRVGPNVTGSPQNHKPWTVKSSKVGGASVGFIIKDSRGIKYLLKFDGKGVQEMETGADVVVAKILHAVGYNVPEDYVVTFRREELIIADDAVKKDPMGHEEPLTDRFIEDQFALVNIGEDGTIRALVSQFLPGIPVGHPTRDGVREDDPNDRIRHERRRDVRGQYAFFSWLDHTDIKGDNTLDIWMEDPENPKHHYIAHYLLDFGNGLGTQAGQHNLVFVGFAYLYDIRQITKALVHLGLWKRPWESREEPGVPGVGLFSSKNYDPAMWRPYTPSYFPFHDFDRFDGFWASKILIRFTEPQLRAAAEEGKYSDSRAVDHITKVLIERQRKTARYWFRRVDPLAEFEVKKKGQGYQLCWTDLALSNGLEDADTHYRAKSYDYEGDRTGWSYEAAPDDKGRACVEGFKPSANPDGYVIVKIDARREHLTGKGTVVHMAVDSGTKSLHVIGLRRR